MMTLSTGHQGWRDPHIHTVRRKVPDDTGRLKSVTVPAPPQVIDYVQYMGGVDRNDQLRAYYTCARKAQFWWKKVVYFLIDIARVNAWICFRQHHPKEADQPELGDDACPSSTMTHLLFTAELATELIDGYARGDSEHHQFRQATTTASCTLKGHFNAKMPGPYPKRCRWCSLHGGVTPKGRPKTTSKGCPVCSVHLCPGRCFALFHSAIKKSYSSSSTSATTATTTTASSL